MQNFLLSKSTMLLLLIFLGICNLGFSQNITITPNGINPSQGLSKMSYSQINALEMNTLGDLVIDTTFNCVRFYNGVKWDCLNFTNYSNLPEITAKKLINTDLNLRPYKIEIDKNENIYIFGEFSSSFSIGNETLNPLGYQDVFLLKLDKNGIFKWIRQGGGTFWDFSYSIKIDSKGFIYVTGEFGENASFGTNSVQSNGRQDVYYCKYDSLGNSIFAKSIGGEWDDKGKKIIVDANDNAYLFGEFSGQVNFGSITTNPDDYSTKIFISKINLQGDLTWINFISSNYGVKLTDVDLNADQRLCIVGSFSGDIQFGSSIYSSGRTSNIFIAKFNTSNQTWYQSFVYALYSATEATAIKTHYNDFIITGKTSQGIFLTKYNNSNNICWTYLYPTTIFDNQPSDLIINRDGEVYLIGTFSKYFSIQNNLLTAKGDIDGFIAKIAVDGNSKWLISFGGTNGSEVYPISGIINKKSELITIGMFDQNAYFGSKYLFSSQYLSNFISLIVEK